MRFAVLLVIALPGMARAQSQPGHAAAARQETFARADAALAAGQRAEAIRILAAAAGRTESVAILLRLARTQAAGGDTIGAMQTLRQAHQLAPNSEEVLRTQAEAALASRAPIAAVRALEPLTRMCPSVAQYRYLSGVARFQAGDAVGATEELEKARERAPDDALTLIALGLTHNARKQYAEAKPVLVRGLDLMPESADALAALAEAEEGLGELDAAERERAAYREALRSMETMLNELRSATGEGTPEARH